MDEAASAREVEPKRDTIWLTGADMANLAIGIVIHVILTRSLLSDDYGSFVLLLDFFHVCVILIDLGLPTLIARDGGRMSAKLPSILNQVAVLQFVVMWVMLVVVLFSTRTLDSTWEKPAVLLLMAAAMQVIAYSFRAAMRSQGEARLEAMVRISDRAVVCLVMVLWADSLVDLALASAIGPCVSATLAMLLFKYGIEPNLDETSGDLPETAELETKELVKVGLPFMVAGAALVINVRIEKLLLGILATPEDVAVFQVAWLGFIAAYAPVLSLRAVLTSWLGEVRDDAQELFMRSRKAFFASIGLGCILSLVGLIISPLAFDTLFPDYSELVLTPFRVLLLAWLFHTIASSPLALIQVGKRPWNYTRILWIGVGVSAAVLALVMNTATKAPMGAAIAAASGALVVLGLSSSLALYHKQDSSESTAEEIK